MRRGTLGGSRGLLLDEEGAPRFLNTLRQLLGRIRDLARSRLGWFLTPFLATLGWTLLWAWYDLAIVGVAFRCTDCTYPNIGLYWTATWFVLFPVSTILAFRMWAWLPILAVWLGGWEDILFYWIQAKPVPHDVSYLVLTPTDEVLFLRAVAFLLASVIVMVLYRRRSASGRRPRD